MIAVNPVHVDIWGTYVTTPIIKPSYADVRIMTQVRNASGAEEKIQIQQTIFNQEGKLVATKESTALVRASSAKEVEVTIPLTSPRKWDISDPHLYTLTTTIKKGKEILDVYNTTFGVRSIAFTADDGFHLNGRRVQLKGVNLHHDHGPLGAVFNKRAMERQLEIMKSMGVNAIRTSHNTPAPEVMELCDRMGILVFSEVFDKYDGKMDFDPEITNFDEFSQRNIKNYILRDRNHPSIFIWSVGNEIGDVSWNIDNGFHRLHTMLNYVNKYDPTRPTTLVCDSEASAALRHFDYYDVHNWNYGRRYTLARKLEPNKSVIISESSSTVSTRGYYDLNLPKTKTDFSKTTLQVSSYDLNAPAWAEMPDDDFMWQEEDSYVAGEFVWTGFDYLGEPTPYHNDWAKENGLTDAHASYSSYFGIVDLVGIPKDRYYLYKSYWNPDQTTVHILPHWNWEGKEGTSIPVFVYTNGDCVELFLNGKSLGKRCKNPTSTIATQRYRILWDSVEYAPGELKAVAYKEGSVIGEQVLKTAGEAYQLRLSPDRKVIKSDGEDLTYILIEAFDKNGNPQPLADHQVQFEIKGEAVIKGVGNGNPRSYEPFQASTVRLFYGKAMLILGSQYSEGKVTVKASSEGLKSATTIITIE